MKKSDFAAFIVYVLMFALAMLVGFLVIRGIVSDANSWGIHNPILLVILSVVVAVIFNALLLEFGHLLGAKAGGYTISMWCLFGLAFKKQPNGQIQAGHLQLRRVDWRDSSGSQRRQEIFAFRLYGLPAFGLLARDYCLCDYHGLCPARQEHLWHQFCHWLALSRRHHLHDPSVVWSIFMIFSRLVSMPKPMATG
jgi:hypothetical protein